MRQEKERVSGKAGNFQGDDALSVANGFPETGLPPETAARKLDSENLIQKLEDLDDPVPHGVAGEVGNGMEAEFTHEIGAMGLRGLDAEMQRHSYFFAGLSFRQQLNNLALSAGKNRGSLILSSFLGSGSSTVGNLPIQKPIQYHLADPGGEEGSVQL